MPADDGHNYTFGAPKGGWPTFVNGKVLKAEEPGCSCDPYEPFSWDDCQVHGG